MNKFNIVFIICIVFVINGCDSPEKSYESALISKKKADFEKLVNDYPESVYSDSAKSMLKDIDFWLKIDTSMIKNNYESYLESYSNGLFKIEAQLRLKEIDSLRLEKIKKIKPIRGKLFGLYAPNDGKFRFYIEVNKDYYDLRFSSESEYIGDKDGSFQLGHYYDVIGTKGPRSFLTKAIGTIDVLRTIYVGEQ